MSPRCRTPEEIVEDLLEGEGPTYLNVLHTLYINPEHLFLGTLEDNTQDMIRKGRHRYRTIYGATNYE